ncbi:hypothetical protein PV328_002847 [Microctonus aethiopoides]|uniref:Uncharacterized protein n=1 Tax=Microctonus aethiopoides TaxID=144406 RepID=A0AA39F7C0_9HYME|nr:hypothetical protein PV328_002847 [Microctonus aethiopoides]
MYREDAAGLDESDPTSMKHPSRVLVFEIAMALFGMVWLLRVRSEMRRCSKCHRDELPIGQQNHQHNHHYQQQRNNEQQQNQNRTLSQTTSLIHTPEDGVTMSSANTLFTLDTPGATGPAGSYCEVHGYIPPKEDIQEFYELTLLDESKSVQQKTAETIRIADKWESSDGPITPTFAQNDGGPASAFPLTQTLLNIYSRRSASPDVPQEHNQKTRYDPRNVDEQLPPPPSPPQIKEPIQLDGISRPNSVERVLHPDTQHNLANHDALNKSHDSWQGHDGDQIRMECN